MLLKEVKYTKPSTLKEAVEMLSSAEGARPLAGGQSLINVMKHRIASPEVLVDLGSIPELSTIEVLPNGSLKIGAMLTYDQIAHSAEIHDSYPVLSKVAGGLADQQVRNRGTIGGNLCFSDPTSNLPPLMVALDATMNIVGPRGERSVPASEFFVGAYSVALSQGELLKAVELAPPEKHTGYGFSILRVHADGWGLVHASSYVKLDADRITDCRIALGCVSDRPVRLHRMEGSLKAQPRLSDAGVHEASEGVEDFIDPVSDAHASAGYRRKMARVIACRSVLEALEEARRSRG